jgi:hypothetical protein
MTKYRIVSRSSYINPIERYYIAQYKFLNLFWKDVRFDPQYPGCASSPHIQHVEEYIDALIHNKQIDLQQKVVKTYE